MLIALQEDWDRDWRHSGFHQEWDNSIKHYCMKSTNSGHISLFGTLRFHFSSLYVITLLFSTAGWRTRKSASKSGHRPTMPAFVHSLHLMIERKDAFTTSSLHYSNSLFSQCPKSFLKSLYTTSKTLHPEYSQGLEGESIFPPYGLLSSLAPY